MGIKIENLFGEVEDLERDKSPLKLARTDEGVLKANPMLAFGKTEGERCVDCVNLMKCGRKLDIWYRCKLRGEGTGLNMKHRKNWEACAKYVKKEL